MEARGRPAAHEGDRDEGPPNGGKNGGRAAGGNPGTEPRSSAIIAGPAT